MSGPVAAILLTVVVHILGMALLFGLMGRDILDVFRAGGGGGGDLPPEPGPDAPRPAPAGSVPLPDAEPAVARLREPGRIAERYGRPARRPEDAPEPRRTPDRV